MKAYPKKTLKIYHSKTQTRIRTVMYLSMKKLMEKIDATENEEDWIEFIKRSTKEAEEHIEKHRIPCWIEVHRRTRWRMARRFVLNEFLKMAETQEKTKYDLTNNNSWMSEAKNAKKGKTMKKTSQRYGRVFRAEKRKLFFERFVPNLSHRKHPVLP